MSSLGAFLMLGSILFGKSSRRFAVMHYRSHLVIEISGVRDGVYKKKMDGSIDAIKINRFKFFDATR